MRGTGPGFRISGSPERNKAERGTRAPPFCFYRLISAGRLFGKLNRDQLLVRGAQRLVIARAANEPGLRREISRAYSIGYFRDGLLRLRKRL